MSTPATGKPALAALPLDVFNHLLRYGIDVEAGNDLESDVPQERDEHPMEAAYG